MASRLSGYTASPSAALRPEPVEPDELLQIGDRVVEQAHGDEAIEVVVTWSLETEVRAYEGEVEAFTSSNSAGVGIRVVDGGRLGFAHAGSLSPDVIAEALADARDNARFATVDPHAGIASPDGVTVPQLVLADERLRSVGPEQKVELALALERQVRALDPRIIGVDSVDYGDSWSVGAVVSTAGVRTASVESAASLMAYILASGGDDDMTTGFGFSVGRHPDDLDSERCAADAVARAVRMIGATPVRSRRTTVVFDPWVTAQFIGLVADMFSADSVVKGRSPFAERLGDLVASPAVTLIDDPTDPRHWGATDTDAEGLATRRNVLISDGRAHSFLHDATTGRMMSAASTGSAVRHGFRSTPSPGPQAVVLLPGTREAAELLADIDDGVLVQEVSGLHSGVNPVSGDFSTGIEGMRIRGGSVAEPIREVTIGSTIQRMLTDVVEVGADLEFFPMEAAGVSLVISDVTVSGSGDD